MAQRALGVLSHRCLVRFNLLLQSLLLLSQLPLGTLARQLDLGRAHRCRLCTHAPPTHAGESPRPSQRKPHMSGVWRAVESTRRLHRIARDSPSTCGAQYHAP